MRVRVLVFVALLVGSAGAGCSVATMSEAGPAPTGTSPASDGGAALDEDAPAEDAGGAKKDAGKDAAPSKDAATLDSSPPGDGGAYASVEPLSGPAFRAALRDLIDNHTSLGYDTARDVMLGITGQFDVTGGMLECIYTGRKVTPDGTRTPNGFNTEHSWPQSLGASSEPARSDLHHLFPVDEAANNARGSLPFAMTSCTTSCTFSNGGSRRGPIVGGSAEVFEVRPVKRGDIARALFYFAVRYDNQLDADEEAALRSWNDADPPDSVERARNDAIETYQKNRNPFVDRPDFVARITDY